MNTELYLCGALGWILLAIAIFLHGRLAREVDRLTRYQNAAKGRGYYTEAEVAAAWERLKHVEQGVVHESPVAGSDAPDTGVSGLSHTGVDRG